MFQPTTSNAGMPTSQIRSLTTNPAATVAGVRGILRPSAICLLTSPLRPALAYDVSAPAVMPWTMNFCRKMKAITRGRLASTEKAIIVFQSVTNSAIRL